MNAKLCACSQSTRGAMTQRGAQLLRCFASAPTQASSTASGLLARLDGTRGVLRLSGPEIIPFLQGLLTNDVRPLERPDAPPVYAALLNAQGRHLHDMFLYRQQGEGVTLLADVDRDALPDLRKKLTMYKLRAAVDIADVSDEFSVWARFSPEDPAAGAAEAAEGSPGDGWHADPRLPALGRRSVQPAGAVEPDSASLEKDPELFRRWRCTLGVAEGDSEMPSGHAMPLEYNLDALNGVSYGKGCYVGQELVARTHHRGVVRKRLMPVSLHGEPPAVGAAIEATAGGEAGKLRAVAGRLGLAHLRLGLGLPAAAGKLELMAGGTIVRPCRPSWWAPEWGGEEQPGE